MTLAPKITITTLKAIYILFTQQNAMYYLYSFLVYKVFNVSVEYTTMHMRFQSYLKKIIMNNYKNMSIDNYLGHCWCTLTSTYVLRIFFSSSLETLVFEDQ